MGKLSDLYKARETFKGLGLELSEEQEAQLRSLEEDIIKRDILPLLTEKIEPALQQVQRELVLVVDYIPGAPLKVSLSRKRNLLDAIEDVVEIPRQTATSTPSSCFVTVPMKSSIRIAILQKKALSASLPIRSLTMWN